MSMAKAKLNILELFSKEELKNFKVQANGSYRGPCPDCGHSSGAAEPFIIFPETNVAYCHKNSTKFNLLECAALKLDIIRCSEGKRDEDDDTPLKGEIFKETLTTIKEEYGLVFYKRVRKNMNNTQHSSSHVSAFYQEGLKEIKRLKSKYFEQKNFRKLNAKYTVELELNGENFSLRLYNKHLPINIYVFEKSQFCFMSFEKKILRLTNLRRSEYHDVFTKIHDMIETLGKSSELSELSESSDRLVSNWNFFLNGHYCFLVVVDLGFTKISLILYKKTQKKLVPVWLLAIKGRNYFEFDGKLYSFTDDIFINIKCFNYSNIFPFEKKLIKYIYPTRLAQVPQVTRDIYPWFKGVCSKYYDGDDISYLMGFASVIQSYIIEFIGFQFVLASEGEIQQGKSNFLSFLSILKNRGRIYGSGSTIKSILRDINYYKPSCYFDDLDKGYTEKDALVLSGIINSCVSKATASYSFTNMNIKDVKKQSTPLNTFAPVSFSANTVDFLHPSTKSRTVLLQSYGTVRNDILRFDTILTQSPIYEREHLIEIQELQAHIGAVTMHNTDMIMESIKKSRNDLKDLSSSRYTDALLIIKGILDFFKADYKLEVLKEFFNEQEKKYLKLDKSKHDVVSALLTLMEDIEEDYFEIENKDLIDTINLNRKEPYKLSYYSTKVKDFLHRYRLVQGEKTHTQKRSVVYITTKQHVYEAIRRSGSLNQVFGDLIPSDVEKTLLPTPDKKIKTPKIKKKKLSEPLLGKKANPTEREQQFWEYEESAPLLKGDTTIAAVEKYVRQRGASGASADDVYDKLGDGTFKFLLQLSEEGKIRKKRNKFVHKKFLKGEGK